MVQEPAVAAVPTAALCELGQTMGQNAVGGRKPGGLPSLTLLSVSSDGVEATAAAWVPPIGTDFSPSGIAVFHQHLGQHVLCGMASRSNTASGHSHSATAQGCVARDAEGCSSC